MIAVSITSIRPQVTDLITALEENRVIYGHEDDSVFYVVTGDKKTPERVERHLTQGYETDLGNGKLNGNPVIGYLVGSGRLHYLSVDRQNSFLTALGKNGENFVKFMPCNKIARRIIGDLFAWLCGADIIIRLDDDNFPQQGVDFFRSHMIVNNQFRALPSIMNNPSGWFNIMDKLICGPDLSTDMKMFPRGFPFEVRPNYNPVLTNIKGPGTMGRVMINQGLWLGNPDLDAVTNLVFHNPRAIKIVSKNNSIQAAMDIGCWCPINSQNTAIHAALLPASFMSPDLGRFDDIMCGYIQRTVMDCIGDFCVYGNPIVTQDRAPRNLYIDLIEEINGMGHVNEFCTVLRGFSEWLCDTKFTNYIDGMVLLQEYLWYKMVDVSEGLQPQLTYILNGLRLWVDIFRELKADGGVMLREKVCKIRRKDRSDDSE